MRPLVLALAALLALAVAALAFAPATLVDAAVASRTEGRLRLADAQGTVWRGRGELRDAAGGSALPLAWSVEPLALARGELDVRLQPGAGAGPAGRVRVQAGRVAVEGLALRLPAAMLGALGPAERAPRLGGTVDVDIPSMTLERTRYAGTGTLRWRSASLAMPPVPRLALGEVEVALAPSGDGVGGTIASRGGVVGVAGELAASPAATSVELRLAADPQLPPPLGRALALAGPWRWQGPPLLR